MKKLFSFTVILFTIFCVFPQSHMSTQSHQQQINSVVPLKYVNNTEKAYFSVGDDGFVIRWSEDGQGEHYQFSDVGIKMIAVSPNGNDIAIYETDGGSVNKVSVWDWRTFSRKYQKKFTDSVTCLTFSAKGTYLIIGTATVDGTVFVKTNGWTVVDKIKTNTSIVNYIHTSETEKTCVLYSPTGFLSFYNLLDGKLKQKINVTKGLSQTLMYNGNSLFAGVKDNNIYITESGKTIASIPALNPIIVSNSTDFNLYYLEYDGKNNYELKMIESNEDKTVSNPRIVKSYRGPRGNASISTASKDSLNLYMGSQNGAIYVSEIEPSITTETMSELTQDIYSQICDMAPAESDFYFLTSNSIYKSSYDTGKVDKLAATKGESKIIYYNDNSVILWSKGSKAPVRVLDFDKKSSEVLFTPKSALQTLRLCKTNEKDYIITIENNGTVNQFDISTSTYKEIYSGTGIQDAILTNDKNIYISKSSATNPKVPLICINPETMETVPLNIKGNVIYALSTDGQKIYGINVISDETGQNTYVFCYNVATKQMSNLLKFAEEDPEAFTYLNGNNLYTNIGKNKVYCYNISSKKRFAYNRSASIPESICQNKNRVVILNSNGSISWCNSSDSKILADWYLTKDEQWYEF